MVLLTVFYPDPDPHHRAELRECLRRNACNDSISRCQVFVEAPADQSEVLAAVAPAHRAKLHIDQQIGRPTFAQLFARANDQYPGQAIILANADIYFDATLQRLRNLELAQRLLCLSRWDVQADGSTRFFDHPASQDAWIFLAPLPHIRCHFPMGVPACDNRLAWQAGEAGLILSNPSRSVRANHLHRSGTRRYSERDRIPGPTREVPSEALGDSWLWFVVAGGSDLELSATTFALTQQRRSFWIVVGSAIDEASPGSLAAGEHGSIIRMDVAHPSPGAAWNRAMGEVDDGIVCLLSAGVTASASCSAHILAGVERETFVVPEEDSSGRPRSLACRRADFLSVGGCDPSPADPLEVLADLRVAFRRARMREHHLAGEPACARLADTNANEISLHSESAAAMASEPLASVVLHEEMGCTVRRLVRGASSHNNDFRPIGDVPDALSGRPFTQVTACRVSPMQLRCLDGGKLFVLVGTDWYGYQPATEWLARRGSREAFAPVKTERGTAFEVWSVLCRAGEQFEIPTQVMLVCDRLVRA